MKKQKFKVGDKVFATQNHMWGLKPMVIHGDINGDKAFVRAKHPSLGIGAFHRKSIEHFTEERQQKVNMILLAQNFVDSLNKEFFGLVVNKD